MCDCSSDQCGCASVAVPVGATGDNGWSPVFAIVTDGARRVQQIATWTGGTGTPPASGLYVGTTGFVSDITLAVDIRGPQGDTGTAGENSYTTVTAGFTQPSVSGNVSVAVVSSAWAVPGQVLYYTTGGYYTVTSIPDSTTLVLTNLYAAPTNTAPTTSISAGFKIGPAGLKGVDGAAGTNGINAFTTVTANFTQPAVSSPVTVTVGSNLWMVAGEPLFIQLGGTYQVVSFVSTNQVVLTNLGGPGAVVPTTVVNASMRVGASGFNGTDGTPGTDGASAYEIAVDNGFVGTEVEWLASLQGSDGAGFYPTITTDTDPNDLSYSPTPLNASQQPVFFGGTYTIWEYSTGSGLWSVIVTFPAPTAPSTYQFRATNTVAQPLPTSGTGESFVSFDDDSNPPNYDPSGSWIDHIYTFQTNQTQKEFKLMNFTMSRPSFLAGAKLWTITIHSSTADDPLGTFNLTFSGSSLSETQAVLNCAPFDFVIGDTVWVSASCSTSPGDQFSVDPGSTFSLL